MKELAIGLEAEEQGAAHSFEAFFEAEHTRLQQALYVVTGNDREAEDLMQEAFLKVWERWARVQIMERPTGNLYRTAMNAFRSRLRRTARAAAHIARFRPSPAFGNFEERDRVAGALRSLSERQRAAIVLTELLDFDSSEAAAMLGVRPSTIRNLAAQGRRALQRILEASDE